MNISQKQAIILRRTARTLALVSLVFGLPFYFGYGNPLPFINPEYTLWDNTWLSIFPLMFIGLITGWKYEKIGGLLIVLPLTFGMLLALFTQQDFAWVMFIPLLTGIFYLTLDRADA